MTPPDSPEPRYQDQEEMRLNSLISRVLIIGLLAAMALLVVGVILAIVRREVAVPNLTSFRDVPAQLAALEPGGFFQLGILVLLATPFARVIALAIAFSARRQWLFVGISVIVAVMLVLGAMLGLTLG
jgi:uncharacterized membrane protein